MTNNLHSKSLLSRLTIPCLLLSAAVSTFAYARPAGTANACLTQRIRQDRRLPSSPLQLISVGGVPFKWIMFANNNTFQYGIKDVDLCRGDRFLVLPGIVPAREKYRRGDALCGDGSRESCAIDPPVTVSGGHDACDEAIKCAVKKCWAKGKGPGTKADKCYTSDLPAFRPPGNVR